MVANKSMGFRPWLQHAAASRLVAMLQNSISQAIQSYRLKPLVLKRGIECAKRIGQIAFNENGFTKPSTQNAIQNDASHLSLLDADRLEIGLMIEPSRSVVVSRADSSGDIERHVHATCDLVEHFILELGISRCRLFCVPSVAANSNGKCYNEIFQSKKRVAEFGVQEHH